MTTRIEHDQALLPLDLRDARVVYADAHEWVLDVAGVTVDVEWVGATPYVHRAA